MKQSLPIPVTLPTNQNNSNMFVFTSQGSMLINCPLNSRIVWLLETATRRFVKRGLNADLTVCMNEQGVIFDTNCLVSDVNHPALLLLTATQLDNLPSIAHSFLLPDALNVLTSTANTTSSTLNTPPSNLNRKLAVNKRASHIQVNDSNDKRISKRFIEFKRNDSVYNDLLDQIDQVDSLDTVVNETAPTTTDDRRWKRESTLIEKSIHRTNSRLDIRSSMLKASDYDLDLFLKQEFTDLTKDVKEETSPLTVSRNEEGFSTVSGPPPPPPPPNPLFLNQSKDSSKIKPKEIVSGIYI